MNSLELVKKYYEAFNNQDWSTMLSLVSDDVVHEPNEGETRIGKELFKQFLQKMDTAYQETLTDQVFFSAENNSSRIATEFVVNGIYKISESGLPEAKGQKYVLPAGAFLEVKEEKISRITTFYNLELWIKLVS